MTPAFPRGARRAALLLACTGLVGVQACDIPSEAPILQQTWIVPTDSASIGAASVLPAGVFVVPGPPASFSFTTVTPSVSTTLGAICAQPACQSATTVTAPTPAFTSPAGLLNSTISFPAGVNGITVTGGQLSVAVNNSLGFDPLRPNGVNTAPYGEVIITVSSGAVSRTDTLRGSPTLGMPNGTTTPLSVTLPTGVYSGTVSVAISVTAPAGGNASMHRDNAFQLQSSLQGFAVSQATVVVNNVAVSTSPVSFSLSDVDVGDHVQGGALLLDIVNPFAATASVDVVLAAPAQNGDPAVTINKAIQITSSPTSSVTVALTQSDLQSLLGKGGVSIRVNGTVNGTGAGNTIVVTPTSQITLRTQLQLILNVGS